MDKLIFSQAGVYRLQQLANQINRQSGVRYKLSQPDAIVALLDLGSKSKDQTIRTYYAAFTNCLNSYQRDLLREHGITLPNTPHEETDETYFSLTG